MSSDAPRSNDSSVQTFPLTRRELGWIALFWMGFAVISIASRMLDPRIPENARRIGNGVVIMATVEAMLWALLTPVLFAIATRIGAGRRRRTTGILLVLLAAIAAAMFINLALDWFRTEMLPALIDLPRARGGRGPRAALGFRRQLEPFAALNDVMTSLAIVAAGLARDYALRYRARQEEAVQLNRQTALLQAQLANARLDALRRQLDPHFLFNTLNAVSGLVERDPRGVRRMIARLSDLLRYSIEGTDEAEVTLERELDMLQRYLDIMQVRFQGRLEVNVRADAEARTALVPSLILQPLVENAVKHGAERVEGTGRIIVDCSVKGDMLSMRVEDNGPGPLGTPARDDAAGGGVGLRNTRERLRQMYGDRQRFTLTAKPSGGAVAEIVMPFRKLAASGEVDRVRAESSHG